MNSISPFWLLNGIPNQIVLLVPMLGPQLSAWKYKTKPSDPETLGPLKLWQF